MPFRKSTSTINNKTMVRAGEELHRRMMDKHWDGVMQLLQQNDDENQEETKRRRKSLLKWKHCPHYNPLHFSCFNQTPVEVVSMLIEIGGRELVLEKENYDDMNSLHFVCEHKNASVEVVSKLIEVGGRDIVLEKVAISGYNALHVACEHAASAEVVSKLLEAGGKDAVFDKNSEGCNPLHLACTANASVNAVLKLLEVGGRDLVLQQDKEGWNPVHHTICNYANPYDIHDLSIDIFDLLTSQGGVEILIQRTSDGKTSLELQIGASDYNKERKAANIALFINKGVQLEIGGEFGIGGLFSSTYSQEVRDEKYAEWEKGVLPALQQVMALNHNHHLPILHAAIMNDAPPNILKDIIKHFRESIFTKDSTGRYPIDVALEHKLAWEDGMQEIVKAFLATQQSSMVFSMCLRNGLPWENGMKIVVEGVGGSNIERKDEVTGLYPFMLAAVRQDKQIYDLGSVFHLITKYPLLLRKYNSGGDNSKKCHSRNRKLL